MSSEREYVTYKQFVESLPARASAASGDKTVVCNSNDGPGSETNSDVSHKVLSGNIAPTFSESSNYFKGNFVEYKGKTYQFKNDHAAGAWSLTDVNQVPASAVIIQVMKSFSRGEFDASTNYLAGEFVWYRGNLWQFNVDHSAGAWVEAECTYYLGGSNPYGFLDRFLRAFADSFSKTGSFDCGELVWVKGLLYLTGYTYSGDITTGSYRSPTYKIVDNSVAELIVSSISEHFYIGSNGDPVADNSFNVYEYDVTGYKTLNIFSAPGGGYHAFYDVNGDIVGSVFRRDDTGAGGRYQCCFHRVSVPSGAVKLKVTNTCQRNERITYDSKPRVYSYSGSVGVELYKLKRAIDTISAPAPFVNKKILAVGDSITDSAKWFPRLMELTGAAKIWNRGVSGTLVAGSGENSFVNRLDKTTSDADTKTAGFPSNSNVDAILLWGGTNDWGNGSLRTAFGSVDGAVDKTTFCGAMRYMIEGLKAKYPGKPIFVLSIMNSQGSDFPNWARLTKAEDGSFVYKQNTISKTMKDYWDAQKEICQLYGVKFVDMFECGISPIDPTDAANYFSDGLHPNDAGAEIIADYIYRCMCY